MSIKRRLSTFSCEQLKIYEIIPFVRFFAAKLIDLHEHEHEISITKRTTVGKT